jgi:hypothetical protein
MDVSATFDRVMKATNSSVSGVKLLVNAPPVVYDIISGSLNEKKFYINEFYKMLGHCGSNRLENAAKIHNLSLNGEFKTYEQRVLIKSRQNNVNKEWKGETQVSGERLYVDISSIKDLSYGGSKFWVLIVDHYTDYSRSIFLMNKSELKNKMLKPLTDLNIAGIDVEFIRCEDSGKKSFYDSC